MGALRGLVEKPGERIRLPLIGGQAESWQKGAW